MISIILNERNRSLVEHVAKYCLKGMRYEVIGSDSWQQGLRSARGDYISFIDPNCELDPNIFRSNLKLFTDDGYYRKLSMIAVPIQIPTKDIVYGYRLDDANYIIPVQTRLSSQPYDIQVGYIPGALIRRNVLDDVHIDLETIVDDSVKLSFDLWSSGKRVMINPTVTYSWHSSQLIDKSFVTEPPVGKVISLWRREVI